MNYKVLFINMAALYLIVGIISPTVRNILKIKNGEEPEKNIGGILAKKICN